MSYTTYNKLAEQVELQLGVRSADADVFRQELILAVKQAYAKIALGRFAALQGADVAEIDGSLIYPFKNVPVSYDADTDEYYATLPTTTAWLPYGLGINQVSSMKDTKRSYIPVSNAFNILYDGLRSSRLQNRIGYYIENTLIKLVNVDAVNNPSSLYIKVVVPFDIDEDTPVNVPIDFQADIVSYVVGLYSAVPQKDITNDNLDQR